MNDDSPRLEYETSRKAANRTRRWRWLRTFFIVAGIVVAADVGIMASLDPTSPAGIVAWWVVNFPSFPCVLGCVSFAAPPMGESEPTSWDYVMMGVSMCITALFWGGVAAAFARSDSQGETEPG